MQEISDYLSPRFRNRVENTKESTDTNDYSRYASYYLILVGVIIDFSEIQNEWVIK